MNVVTRGFHNAFRNVTRTISVVLILSLSIGLSLVMLIANRAVEHKIQDTLKSVGNTVSIQPAGATTGGTVGAALTDTQIDKLKKVNHVASVSKLLVGHLKPDGTTDQPTTPAGAMTSRGGGDTDKDTSNATTNLKNPFKLDCNKGTCAGGGVQLHNNGSAPALPSNFSLPLDILGTTTPTVASIVGAQTMQIVSGTAISGTADVNKAMISQDVAAKNSLKVGDTFTAYGKTLTLAAIFKADTESANSTIVVSLATMQRLSNQSGVVSRAVATVDSLEHLADTTTAIKATLGSGADVTSRVDEANDALKPLRSVQSISLYSFIGSVVAASIIILLVMIMIVRERKREIGIYKAIGHSNLRIMVQFAGEALTFTIMAAIVGAVIGLTAGSSITTALVSKASGTGGDSMSMAPPGLNDLAHVQATVGWGILLAGLAAILAVAIAGSMTASFFIAKVRPAEVLRNE